MPARETHNRHRRGGSLCPPAETHSPPLISPFPPPPVIPAEAGIHITIINRNCRDNPTVVVLEFDL